MISSWIRKFLFIYIVFTSTIISQENLYPIVSDGLWGYMDENGNEIIQPEYIQCGVFSNGLAVAKKGLILPDGATSVDRIGYITEKNEFKSLYNFFSGFDIGRAFYEERAAVRLPAVGIFSKTKWGFIDTSFNVVVEPEYFDVGNFSEGLAWVEKKVTFLSFVLTDEYGYINRNGELVIPFQFEQAGNFFEGIANVMVDGKKGFINKKGEIIVEPRFELVGKFSQGLAPVKLDGKWGFINRNDSIVIPLKFEDARSFSEDLALVMYQGKWGFIDHSGKFVISPQFKNVSDFVEGAAPALLTDKWGFINKEGNIKIEPQFDYASGFNNGRALVELDGKRGYINMEGIFVWRQSN